MIKSPVTIRELTGLELNQAIEDLASLRITVFREYPYLYDGTLDYERSYLQGLAHDPDALVIIAESEGKVVAAATSLPLLGPADITHSTGVEALFRKEGLLPEHFYYFSEIIVLPAFRNAGIAKSFYERRCAFAKKKGFAHLCFAAILSKPHRNAPASYFSPELLWRKLGFQPKSALTIDYAWPTFQPDGSTQEEVHQLRFWIKEDF